MRKNETKNIFSGLKIKKKKLSDKEKQEMLAIFMHNIELKKSSQQQPKVLLPLPRILIAASVIGIICLFSWKFIAYKTLYASENQTITLSDNTCITLRSGTSLSYSPVLFRLHRNVSLAGEAFFDVKTKGAFSVSTNLGEIKVLGTEFQVTTTPEFNTQCFKGVVEMQDKNAEKSIILYQGEQATLIDGSLIKSELLESKPYWTNNKFNFKNKPLTNVTSILAKHYHLKISGLDVTDGLDFSGSFPSNNLDVACKLVFGPYNLLYKVETDTLTISHPF